jgi:DNA-directed RNA polymerase specialized sigma24 family protein
MPKFLTSEAFEKLLDAFSSDEAEAAAAYTKLRNSLVRFFQVKGLLEADEAADETIDRVADKLNQATEIEDLRKFAFGVARFVCLEKLRKEQTRARAAQEFYLKDFGEREFGETDEVESFRECFGALYKTDRELVAGYFEDLDFDQLAEKRKALAEREKVTLNVLRIKVSRIRKRLEECFREKNRKNI